VRVLISVMLILSLLSPGCSFLKSYYRDIPTIDLPEKVEKPPIKSKVIEFNGIQYVCYTWEDAFLLYKYLLERDGYDDKLIFRVNQMNQIIQKK